MKSWNGSARPRHEACIMPHEAEGLRPRRRLSVCVELFRRAGAGEELSGCAGKADGRLSHAGQSESSERRLPGRGLGFFAGEDLALEGVRACRADEHDPCKEQGEHRVSDRVDHRGVHRGSDPSAARRGQAKAAGACLCLPLGMSRGLAADHRGRATRPHLWPPQLPGHAPGFFRAHDPASTAATHRGSSSRLQAGTFL